MQDARDELAQIWLEVPASDRGSVTTAANRADRQLSTNPTAKAVYLSEGLWKLQVPPLTLYFDVSEDKLTVQVTNVVFVA
ncbi:MAG: hypothetical protein CMJ64_08100 [Planctomycetaceae bacterium]|nr:hypothetical protein [Planctomycetaceae bacterium]